MRTLRVLEPDDEAALASMASECLMVAYQASANDMPRAAARLTGIAMGLARITGVRLDHEGAEHEAKRTL